MHILIESSSGPDIDIHVHANGTATVRVNNVNTGSCRWEKDGNRLRLSLSDEQLRRGDNRDGMTFNFEGT